MIATLHLALNNCPDYIHKEAGIILSRVEELAPDSDAVRIKLSHSDMFYRADISIDSSGKLVTFQSKSRYLEDALEDSFLKMSGLLQLSCKAHDRRSELKVDSN